MKHAFSVLSFEKYSDIKFHENRSSGGRVVPRGRTDRKKDRHDEANSRFSKFFERAWKPKYPYV